MRPPYRRDSSGYSGVVVSLSPSARPRRERLVGHGGDPDAGGSACSSLRADAQRNRAALLAAARAVFAEQGLDASLDQIARRAGVGIGTLYRRFPSRADLIEAVFVDRMAAYVGAAEDAESEPEPWQAFSNYVLQVLSLQAEDRAVADLLVTTSVTHSGELEELRTRGLSATIRIVERARSSGDLRADFTHQDVVLLLMANAGLVHRTADAAPHSWRRHAAFVLDGLRASAATPAPPAPSDTDMRAAMGRHICR